MTTTSRPANGNGGFSDADWAVRFGAQDGIIEDYTGHALDMTLLNSDEAQFTDAKVSINGYTLSVFGSHRVGLPAPTSGSKTYYICAVFDPALNGTVPVTQPDGTVAQMATEAGPCRLVAFDGAVDTTGGKRSDVQYVVTRTSASLSSATVASRRRWIGVPVESPGGLPPVGPATDGVYPRGSVLLTTGRLYVRTLNSANPPVLDWIDPLASGPFSFPFKSGFTARAISGNKVQYRKRAGMVMLSGDLQRSSGGISGDTIIGQLPPGFRPETFVKAPCSVSGTGYTCEVRVDPNGDVTATDSGRSFSWINLSPVIFEATN